MYDYICKNKVSPEFPGGLAVRDSVLSLLWLRFNPRPRNFCMLQAQQNKVLSLPFQFLHSISFSFFYLLIRTLPKQTFLRLNILFATDCCHITSVKLKFLLLSFIENLIQKMLLNLSNYFLYQLRSSFPAFGLLI